MSDARGLLLAICEQPEDDAPRLIYADWLDEHGASEDDRARAEFIRLQCEAARLPLGDEDIEAAERRTRLELRADDLLRSDEARTRWVVPVTAPPPGISFRGMTDGGFVRGFPRFALAGPTQFLALGEELFRLNPVHIVLSRSSTSHQLTPEPIEQFLDAPWLRRIRRLDSIMDGRSGERLLRAENLIGLEELTVREARFLPPGSPIDGEAIGSLREINLWSVRETRSVLPRVAELLSGRSLIALGSTVSRSAPVEMCRELATLQPFRGLQRLALAGPGRPLPGEALRQLMAAPFWPNLRRLSFHDWGFGNEAAEALAEAGPAPNLRTLRLSVHSMTRRGIAALARCPVLRSVTTLDLGCGNGVGDDGVALLAQSPYLRNLAELNLPVGELGPKGIQAIADAPWAANLVRMDLRDNAIRKAGVELLADPKRFPRLLRLDLQRAVRTSKLKAVLTARFGSGVRFTF
jgi:uncharacterized protein (TIGR02996 family)